MNFKIIKRSYFIEFLSIAFVGLLYCLLTLYGFVGDPAMKNDTNLIGGFLFFAVLFVWSILGLFFKWSKTESINVDGIRYRLYRKNIFIFLFYTGVIDASILMLIVIMVSFFANIVDYCNLSLNNLLISLLIYLFLIIIKSYSNFKKYKMLNQILKDKQ